MNQPANPTIVDIEQQRAAIAEKITVIKQRLNCSYSEPLRQHYIELLKQDMKLCCQLTDLLQ